MKKLYKEMLKGTTLLNTLMAIAIILGSFGILMYSMTDVNGGGWILFIMALISLLVIPLFATLSVQLVTAFMHLLRKRQLKHPRTLAIVSCTAQILHNLLLGLFVIIIFADESLTQDTTYFTIVGGLIIYSLISTIYQVINIILIACDK